jgi:hypothetical protein
MIADEGYDFIRKETQQVSHDLPPVRKGIVPYPKVYLLVLWVSQQEDATVQLGTESQGSSHNRNWPYALHEVHDTPIQERIQRGHTGKEAGCELTKCKLESQQS